MPESREALFLEVSKKIGELSEEECKSFIDDLFLVVD
jgi:polyhydroxyalkanoate synthesis regulator phasin